MSPHLGKQVFLGYLEHPGELPQRAWVQVPGAGIIGAGRYLPGFHDALAGARYFQQFGQ